jgi:hypothetical protein
MVFLVKLRQELERAMPEVGRAVAAEWPSALLGCEAPDSHFFTEQHRPDLHMLDQKDPGTWPGAVERWLEARPELAPGREQPAATVAFVVGYLSHIGLDTWAEQYLSAEYPAAAREGMPTAWYPEELQDAARRRAALQRMAEEPVAEEFQVDAEALRRAPVPEGFRAEPIRAIATGILPALALVDPWEQSRVQPLPGREPRPDTPEEREKWEAERAARPRASVAELHALVGGALDFTMEKIRRWW